METIHEGATGAAVEDIQERLTSLGYAIEDAEREGCALSLIHISEPTRP